MNRRLLLIPLFVILIASLVFGQSALPCTETANTGNTLEFNNMLLDTYQTIQVFGEDEAWSAFTEIIPNETSVLQGNETETVAGGSTTTLDWDLLDTGTVSITNTTGSAYPNESLVADYAPDSNTTAGNWTYPLNVSDGNLTSRSGINASGGQGTYVQNYTTPPECTTRATSYAYCVYTNGTDLTSNLTPADGCWKGTSGNELDLRATLTNDTTTTNLLYECYNSTAWTQIGNESNVTGLYGCYVNYTVDAYSVVDATGVVTWGASCRDTETAYVLYNKTLNSSVDLVDYATKWQVDGNTTWNEPTRWQLLTADLNNTGWNTTYSYTDRDCAGRDSCRNTQVVVYAAFALIALFAIVGAAFFIISMVSGGSVGTAAGGALVVTIIGLGIIVMIGYYIINVVGVSIC